jgi:hypothetical protein
LDRPRYAYIEKSIKEDDMHPSNDPSNAYDANYELSRLYYLLVEGVWAWQRIWHRLLTPAERTRFGGEFLPAFQSRGALKLWQEARGGTETRAVIDLAHVLNLIDRASQMWLMRETGEYSDDPEEALQMALDAADLVVQERPRAIFWNGGEVQIDWYENEAPWNYCRTLIVAAHEGRAIDATDFSEHFRPDYHVKQKARLKTLDRFPQDLFERIRSIGSGGYRLEIPRDRIRIIELSIVERAVIR